MHFKHIFDGSRYEIVIKLNDGRIIGGDVRKSIYTFVELKIIDNYRIDILSLEYPLRTRDSEDSHDDWIPSSISSEDGIATSLLEVMLNKPYDYFGYDLNKYIDNYDEINEFIVKIRNENRIPGNKEDVGEDVTKWGDEEELQKYTGYYNGYILFPYYLEKIKAKVFIEYVGTNYE